MPSLRRPRSPYNGIFLHSVLSFSKRFRTGAVSYKWGFRCYPSYPMYTNTDSDPAYFWILIQPPQQLVVGLLNNCRSSSSKAPTASTAPDYHPSQAEFQVDRQLSQKLISIYICQWKFWPNLTSKLSQVPCEKRASHIQPTILKDLDSFMVGKCCRGDLQGSKETKRVIMPYNLRYYIYHVA